MPDQGTLNPVTIVNSATSPVPVSLGVYEQVNAQSGTTYTVLSSDWGKLVTHSNASSIAVTLPQADAINFVNGWFFDVLNLGSGTVTITPTTSTIQGGSTLVLKTGQGARIVSDATNYSVQPGAAGTYLNGITAGTVTASKAIIVDANKHIDTLGIAASGLKIGASGSETAVTASGTELNTLADLPATASMASTPASGTCAVQLTIKNAAGSAIGHAISGVGYLSTSNGLAMAAATGVAVLTNGALTELVTGTVFHFVSTAAGLLGATVTAAAGSYYITLQMPNGKLVTTSAIVVNA